MVYRCLWQTTEVSVSTTIYYDKALSCKRIFAMTYAARQVLEDCRLALDMLEEEKDLSRWKVLWAGAVALVRAVGHVLDKVDGANPLIKKISSEAFRKWNSNDIEHLIFREFIEKERNNILKEYKFNHHPLDEVDLVLTSTLIDPETGDKKLVGDIFPIADNIYRPLLSGFREGDDARDVLSDAINWWDTQLKNIESKI